MIIYQLVFGTDSGQVRCVFHDDNKASAGIGPNGEYNCFTCGVKAHDEVGFIMRYFNVPNTKALSIKGALERLQGYRYNQRALTQEQLSFLKSKGITEEIAKKYFFDAQPNKLIYRHDWCGVPVGYTWFNSPELSSYNMGWPKYKYDKNNIGGMVTPYDVVTLCNSFIITEGEKDMLTLHSFGAKNTVAKLGGAKTLIVGGLNMNNKHIVIIYDCDDAGREGALTDADYLTDTFASKVKVVDLGLQNGEDVNDYFMKYNKSITDLQNLIRNTPVHIVQPKAKRTKMQTLLDSLTPNEVQELKNILKENN